MKTSDKIVGGIAVGLIVMLGIILVVAAVSNSIQPAPPAAQAPQSVAPTGVTWTFPNQAGQIITVSESNSTGFTGGVPTPVSLIDKAAAAGDCSGLKVEFDQWDGKFAGTPTGERAGAYAEYARKAGGALGCSWTDL